MQIEYSIPSEAQYIMDKDSLFLKNINITNPAILHFHNWKYNAITYGYFTNINKYFEKDKIKKERLDLAKRPSGGGIVFHSSSFSFSFILHKSHPLYHEDRLLNYSLINGITKDALKELFPALKYSLLTEDPRQEDFCMARPTKYDILVGGKKLCGASQRHTPNGMLHQAVIALSPPHPLKSFLDADIIATIYDNSTYLPFLPKIKLMLRESIQHHFIKTFS